MSRNDEFFEEIRDTIHSIDVINERGKPTYMFKEYYAKNYCLIDILPEQVPEGGEGQFFAIEKFFLQQAQLSELQKKFLNLLLKLNCYYDFEVWAEHHNNYEKNPSPDHLEELMMKQEEALHIVLQAADSLIVSRPDDLYMTVYNPDERLLGLLKKLVSAEGLFVWKPKRQFNTDGRFIGVDGCKGGWIAAVIEKENLTVRWYKMIEELIDEYPDFDAFLIDMPIGLPESKAEDKNRPDVPAREMIRPRGSTIFSAPCRQTVNAEGKDTQKNENKRVLGRSLSEQSINIIPKIREMDDFLKLHSEYQNVICESHPELCFAKLKGKVVLSKKNTKEGFEERKEILSAYLDPAKLDGLREKAKELKCNPDDVMDAVCLAVVAVLKAQGEFTTVPLQPEADARGLFMQMIIPDEKKRS